MNANINFVNLDLVAGEVCDDRSQVWRERAVSEAPDMGGSHTITANTHKL